MHNPLAANSFGRTYPNSANWLVVIVSSATAIGMTVRAAIVGGDDWQGLVILVPLCVICAITAVGSLMKSEKRKWKEAAMFPAVTEGKD